MTAAAASTPWLPASAARPLVCWRDAQLDAMRRSLDDALAAWCADWGLPGIGRVTCEAVATIEGDRPWRSLDLDATAGTGAWLHMEPDVPAQVHGALFGDGCAGPLATRVAGACLRDGQQRLFAVLALRPSTDAPEPLLAGVDCWAGLVSIRMPAPLSSELLVAAAGVARWMGTHGDARPAAAPVSPALSNVRDAVAAIPVRLHVQLEGCELDIGTLRALQPGGVVRMQHRIASPAAVHDDTGNVLFSAYLGRRSALRAVEFAASAGVPAPAQQESQP